MGIAGLPKPRFATKTSSTTRSTTSATLANATRSSNYSQTKSSAVSFGIRAQRSTVGSGLVFNPSQYNSGYISQQRHAYNDNRPRFYNMPPVQNHKCNGSGGMSTLDKIMAFNALAQNLTGTTAQVINALKTPQSNQTSGAGGMNGGSPTSIVTESITDMRSATSSIALDNAIKTAREESKSLPTQITKAETELNDLKKPMPEIEDNCNKLTEEFTQVCSSITTLENSKTSIENHIKSLQSQVPLDETTINSEKSLLNRVIADLEALNKKKTDLETRKKAAVEAQTKQKEAIEAKEKEIKELKDKKQSIDQELLTQNKRLEQLKKSEKKTLDSLQSDIDKLIKDFKNSKTSDAKKQEIRVKYQAKVQEFKTLLQNSRLKDYKYYADYLE